MPERPSQSPADEPGPPRPRSGSAGRPRTDDRGEVDFSEPEGRPPGRIAASIDRATASLKTVRRLTGARVGVNLRCTKCDYNLRGLDTGTVCPECGAPVGNSLAMTPESRDAAERVAGACRLYGTGNLWSAAFALIVLAGPTGIVGGIGCLLVFLGCGQRWTGLMLMNRHHPERNPGDRRTFGGAFLTATLETAIGGIVFLSLLFDVHISIFGAKGHLVLEVLVTAWAGAVGLGIVASALMADSIARQYSLDVSRSILPFVMGFLAPCCYLVYVVAAAVAAGGGGALFSSLSLLAGFAALGAWLGAGWIASAYVTGITDMLNGLPAVRSMPGPLDRIAPIQAHHSSPAEQDAARKLKDDDSPIPMD